MHYKLLNTSHRQRMKQITNQDFQMEWEDPDFLDTLLGAIPDVRHSHEDSKITGEISSLKKLLASYNAFTTNREKFVQDVRSAIDKIRNIKEDWFGLSAYEVQECVQHHDFCLISGEAGIGKSYFIMCVEEKLEQSNVPHLCLYGKFENEMGVFNIKSIIKDCENGFIFIVDAINEMSESGQIELLNLLKKLKQYPTIRFILTYRTDTMNEDILSRYRALASSEYRFPGVSFYSALGLILKSSAPDVYKYEDILYSNNALLLNMLGLVLRNQKLVENRANSVSSITFILEQYVKGVTNKQTRCNKCCSANDVWRDVKAVARWMYKHEQNSIPVQILLTLVKTGPLFFEITIQSGLMSRFNHGQEDYAYFTLEYLSDFLIARSLFEDLESKTYREQIEIITRKAAKLNTIKEGLIIALFDKFSPDYIHIRELLEATDLLDDLTHNTLIKINFEKEHIARFLTVFQPYDCNGLLLYYGGYTDKPFNCTNFLNTYYMSQERQNIDLSLTLEGSQRGNNIKSRLKNLLYFTILNQRADSRAEEAYYFSLWCSGAPNKDIRLLATKLLYELTVKYPAYKSKLVNDYKMISDLYIKEAILFILSSYQQNDREICESFRKIKKEERYLSAKSIKRIATYLNDKYGYIRWNRNNLYHYNPDVSISDFLDNVLYRIDLHDQTILPFRYWARDHLDMYTNFLSNDKQEISKLNGYLKEEFACVKDGFCSGLMAFEKFVLDKIGYEISIANLDMHSFLSSYESVLVDIFDMYRIEADKKELNIFDRELQHTQLLKCIDIATGIYLGSLMCNYYTDCFATFNNHQDSIGYEVYDPFELDETSVITTPISHYQRNIEKLGDCVISRLQVPTVKDLSWVRDVSLTKTNLLSLLAPCRLKNNDWVLLAGRISLYERRSSNLEWKDTYDIWCCTSETETIRNNGLARYLTIELEEYDGYLHDYHTCMSKPWLCKRVKGMEYDSKIFEETTLVLPPADLVSYFDLRLNVIDSSWINQDDENIIICNNNKNSYYRDPIGSTVFIKKEYLDSYLRENLLKYFAYTERYIPETGFADETSLHFEIQDGEIIKEIPNRSNQFPKPPVINESCKTCPHGFKESSIENTDLLSKQFEDLLKNYLGEE